MDPVVWEGLLGLFAIAIIVFAVLGGRVWRIPTVLTVVGLAIAVVTFFVLAALTLRTHAKWREHYKKQDAEFVEAQEAQRKLRDGELMANGASASGDGEQDQAADEKPADGDAAPDGEVSAEGEAAKTKTAGELLNRGNRQLRKLLGAVRQGRGKTWYGTGKFTAPTADVTITEPNAAQIVQNMPVFVFEDKEGKPEGVFIGAFKVTTIADKSLKLTLTETLSADQLKRITGKDGNWIIRSIMPVDSHDAFVGMSREKIMAMIPQAATGLDPAAYAKLIDEYANDGKDIAGAPPERVFHEFKLTKEMTIDVKEGMETKKVPMKEGDIVTVNAANTEMLAALKAADAIEKRKFYERPLRNYEHTFRTLNLRMLELADRSAQVTAQTAAVEAAIKSANEVRLVALEKEVTGLTADKTKMVAEQSVVKKYLADVQKLQSDLMAAMQKHYGDNNQMAAELTKIQLEMAKKLETQASAKQPSEVESAAN